MGAKRTLKLSAMTMAWRISSCLKSSLFWFFFLFDILKAEDSKTRSAEITRPPRFSVPARPLRWSRYFSQCYGFSRDSRFGLIDAANVLKNIKSWHCWCHNSAMDVDWTDHCWVVIFGKWYARVLFVCWYFFQAMLLAIMYFINISSVTGTKMAFGRYWNFPSRTEI